MRNQLLKRGFPGEAAEVALLRLGEMGYLDDIQFARRFAEDRRRMDSWGDRRIRKRLAELGTDRDAIDQALSVDGGSSELERAIELLERRLAAPAEREPERRRAMGILIRRGYSMETASDAVREHSRAAR
ncbi:MAG: regulatory protein RecX [Actinomycetes bacterium]